MYTDTATISSGSVKGNGFRSVAERTPKTAVLAPMPSASVSTATAANPGFLRSVRRA
jgi:hypothetical protein